MKNKAIFLANIFLFSTLFWGVPTVEADEIVLKEPAEATSYCHMKFPEVRPETLSWEAPILDAIITAGRWEGTCTQAAIAADE